MSSDRFKFRIPEFTDKGTFTGFQYIELGDEIYCTLCGYIGEPQQCTGLKDKNDNLIYEGDYLGDIYGGVIRYCDRCKSFELFFGDDCSACEGDLHWEEIVEEPENLLVLGNIYENPELLEVW